MSPSSGRTLGISGWLVAATVVTLYLMARYDVTIQERGPATRAATLAAAVNLAPSELKPVVDERYTHLAAEAQEAAGADLPALDRRLEAAEREFPSDYRFTYERATLSVYGRADHHEAFFHLFRAAEKAIGTGRSLEMLDRLERDGRPDQRLRRLAAGHDEWSALHEALENRDRNRLWSEHASHRPVPSVATERVPTRVSVSSRLDHATPCIDALIALRKVRVDPKAESDYHRLEKLCLRGSARAQPPGPAPGRRHR